MDDKERALYYYRLLSRTRALQIALIMNRNKIFGAFLTGLGQEAVSVGACLALMEKGVLVESGKSGDHRTNWGIAVVTDELTNQRHNHAYDILKTHFGKVTSSNRGRDGNIHWGCTECGIVPFASSDMGRMATVTVGYAENLKRNWRDEKRPVGIAFLGEGAFQQGGVYEAMNWAAVSNYMASVGIARGAPVIFIINKNQFALYTDSGSEHGFSDLSQRALGFGDMVGIDVDGNDLEAMIQATSEAIDRAQSLKSTLIVADTYRLTGHNEDQIRRDPERVKGGDVAHGEILGVDPEEFKKAWKKEPLKIYRNFIVHSGRASNEELDAVYEEEFQKMLELTKEALAEPDVDLEEHKKDFSLFPPYSFSLPEKPNNKTPAEIMKYNEAFLLVMEEIMERDPAVTYFGEDVGSGGVLVKTRQLRKKFGEARVFDTPLSEEAIVGTAAGRALGGAKTFCEFQFGPFWWDSASVFASVLAPNWYQKRMKFPVVAIFHCGVVHEGGSGQYHESFPEGYLIPMEGIAVVSPANAYDLVGLMRMAYEFAGPIAVILQIKAYGNSEFASEIPEEQYLIPLGKAEVKRAGKDFTVVTYGACAVSAALNEAKYLAEDGIDIEVVDLRTIYPPDMATIGASIAKTGRVAVFHEATLATGAGPYLVSKIVGEGLMPHIRTPEIKILAPEKPIPSVKHLVWDRLPFSEEEIPDHDAKGREFTRRILRSPKLAGIVRGAMEY